MIDHVFSNCSSMKRSTRKRPATRHDDVCWIPPRHDRFPESQCSRATFSQNNFLLSRREMVRSNSATITRDITPWLILS